MSHIGYRPALPHDWRWQPLDSLASVKVSTVDKKSYEDELPVSLCNYTDVYYNYEITGSLDFMKATATPSQIANFSVQAGDVVITKDSETSDDIGRPAYVPEDLPGIVYGYHLAIYKPFDPRYGKFLRYLFDATWVRAELRSRTPGVTRVGLNQDTLRHLRVPVPSPSEAQKIAEYLDRETAEIDAFIGDQKAFRRLLIERWVSGLVNIVQPQLLEPNPVHARQLRPSWTRTRLKSTVESEKNGSWGSEEGDGQVTRRCIRVADFDKHSGRIHSRSETNRSYPIDQASSLALKTGDLLIEKSGGGPTSPVGNVVLYTGPGGDLYSNFVARLRLRADIDPRFALYLHRSLYLSGVTNRSIKQTTGIQNLDSSSYFNETAWLPPLEEQKVLGQRVEAQRDFIDETLEDVDRSIELAQERRSALISTAVTGQIDVTAQDVSVAEQLQDKLEVHL